MILDHPINCAQAQACTFANRLRRVEGIEDSLRLTNARSCIGKSEHGLFTLAFAP